MFKTFLKNPRMNFIYFFKYQEPHCSEIKGIESIFYICSVQLRTPSTLGLKPFNQLSIYKGSIHFAMIGKYSIATNLH